MTAIKLPNLNNVTIVNRVHPIRDSITTLVELFGTYCQPCRMQMPHMAKIAKANVNNLNVVAISSEPKNVVEDTIDRIPSLQKYNVAVDTTGETNPLKNIEGVDGVPHAFIFNKDKDLIWHGHPALMDDILQRLHMRTN